MKRSDLLVVALGMVAALSLSGCGDDPVADVADSGDVSEESGDVGEESGDVGDAAEPAEDRWCGSRRFRHSVTTGGRRP